MVRVSRMDTMNGKYATAAWYVCGVWHKVAYRILSMTPSVGAFGVLLIMLPCLTCWNCMCDGMLIETNAPPPPPRGLQSDWVVDPAISITRSDVSLRLSVCVVYLSSTSSLSM
jgi:hypothetical protein